MHPSLSVRSIVLDFDGTVCPDDVSDRIFDAFAPPVWRELDREYEEGRIGSRPHLMRLAELLRGTRREILAWTLEHHRVDPTFPPFVQWAREHDLRLLVVSDGLGFHIDPVLRAAGIEDLEVVSNRTTFDDGAARVSFPSAHPECVTCGACKMLAVTRLRDLEGPLAYVGDGHSDRFGALYSDVVFAKGALADLCRREGVAHLEWETFEDVRRSLEGLAGAPLRPPPAPARCPGWGTA